MTTFARSLSEVNTTGLMELVAVLGGDGELFVTDTLDVDFIC